MPTDNFQRKLTAILSADVVGYSRLMSENEPATVKTLETYKGVMSSLIKQHRGRVVDSPGDNLLAEFGSVVDAVQCAVSIQKELQTRNADLPENRRMEFRIGINLGDVIEEEDRIYGDGVNIAARLEALCDPGGICVSKTAFDQIESKLPLGYEFLGEQTVKNIPKPIGAYRVLMEPRVTTVKEVEEKKAVPFWRRKAAFSIGIIVILAIVALLYWNFYLRGPSIEPASIKKMAYPLPDRPSIAVLPFDNLSGDPEQDYIGDGLSESIISALSVSSHLFVIARNTTFTYKGKAVDIKQVAEDLGVQYVLEGSILKSGDRVRVTGQLIDALGGHHLWAEVYDREMRELFELLDEITKKIVVSLQVELTDHGEDLTLFAKSTDNLEAWKHYIKGIELYENFKAKDNQRAREHFEAALELDPAFVAALSMLARTHSEDFVFEWSNSPLTSMNLAFELAQKAVELDEQNPHAHAVLGYIFLFQKQHEKAITEGKRAITLNPNYAYGHVILAATMHYSGRFDEAITLCKKASRLNPNLPAFLLDILAKSYIFLQRYQEALEVIRQWEEHAPPGSRIEVSLKCHFSWVYQELGREEEARAYMAEALKIKPDYSLENSANDPYKDPTHLQRWQDALHKAGMPEKPPGAVQEKPSIAVLPFDNLSSDPEQEYFVLGLSEEILNSISKISGLHVTSKTSSFAFKDTDKTIKEIAEILDRDYILEGSVRKASDSLRITAQLIDVADDRHLWSESYDRELKDIFKIQEDIANNVADKLRLTLESLKLLGGTEDVDAYELYLTAKGKRAENNMLGFRSALELLDKATDLDPRFALAWAYKALIHNLIQVYGPLSISQAEIDAGIRDAQKAIDLEPDLAVAYIYLAGNLSSNDPINGERNYQKALDLVGESLSFEHHTIMAFYLGVGRPKRALDLLERMRRNDPNHQAFLFWYYFVYGFAGDRQRAEELYENRNKLLLKDYSDWHDECITMVRLGSGDVLSRDEIKSFYPANIKLKEYLDSPKEGLKELHKIYRNEDSLTNQELAFFIVWAAYFGDFDFALEIIEDISGVWHSWYPKMREVRRLPRFKEYVKEIGLVDYWKEYGWPDLCRPVGDDDFVCD